MDKRFREFINESIDIVFLCLLVNERKIIDSILCRFLIKRHSQNCLYSVYCDNQFPIVSMISLL